MEFRLMRPGEERAVSELALRVYDRFVADQLSPQARREFQSYSDPLLLRFRSRWNHLVLLAVAEDAIAGMIEVRDDGHVALFFVEGEHQGEGVGGELLRRSLSISRRRRPDLTKATVNSSPKAVAIYERLGFRKSGDEVATGHCRLIPMVRYLGVLRGDRDPPLSPPSDSGRALRGRESSLHPRR
jgi:GNAT superfamily N-acetyltransferase